MTDMTVSHTILQQLGGSRFIVMTGSKCFVGSNDALSFRVGSNEKKVNCCRITLTPMDTYKVEFMKIRGLKAETLAIEDGVYAEDLAAIFTLHTGMYTTLGTMGARR